jgi:dihydrofolate reductase
MRKLIMQLELTLDGFYAGEHEEFDWFTLDPEWWAARVQRYLPSIDTVLLGRKNYEGFQGYWPNMASFPHATDTDKAFSRWLDDVPKVVFSTTLEKTEWTNSRLVNDDLVGEVSRLKAASGKDILIMSSASVAQACMAHGLIDEYWLTVHPVTLGRGLPLFKERVNLELLESKAYPSGQVFLHYATRHSNAVASETVGRAQ